MSLVPRSLDVPGIVCPGHGLQVGLTRCKWCGFDPLKFTHRSNLLPGVGGFAPSVFIPEGVSYSQDSFLHEKADVLEAA